MLDSFKQSAKAATPILDICLGIVIEVIPSEPRNTVSPISVMPSGMITVVRLSILKNMLSGIDFIPADSLTYFKL